MSKYFLNRYNSQEMCDKAVDAYLPALKFVLDWLVANKMIKRLDNIVILI